MAFRPIRLFLALAVLAGCNDKPTDSGPAAVASLTLSPTGATIAVGATATFTATARDADGESLTGRTVTWSSSSSAIASVANGIVSGVTAGGPVTITATSEGKNASVQVTVTPPPVATVALTPSNTSIELGATTTLVAALRDAGGTLLTGRTITWTSGNPAVATVVDGVVTSVTVGSTTITASSEGKNGTAQITVTPIAVATVTLTPPSATFPVTTSTTLAATMRDGAGNLLTGRTVTWSTSNAAVATVVNGVVTGVSGGNATITALSEGKSATASLTIQAIVAETNGRIGIAANHACAIKNDGTTWCWGQGAEGALGTGANTDRLLASLVLGGRTFTQLTTGHNYTCALDTAGAAWCWGANNFGQLGDGTTTNRNIPVAVAGGHIFTKIDAGGYSTACAREASGALWCWGYNANGTIGDGGSANALIPTVIGGGLLFTTFSVGEQAVCGQVASGQMYCWGNGTGGALGNGTSSTVRTPTAWTNGFSFVELKGGQINHCGRRDDWTIYCWGINQNYGLGLGSGPTSTTQSSPSKLSGNVPWLTTPSLGDWHGCARTLFGIGWCWGSAGRTGDGSNVNQISPVLVSGGLIFTEINSGFAASCGRTTTDEFWCWGVNNAAGVLGDMSVTNRLAPVKVQGFAF